MVLQCMMHIMYMHMNSACVSNSACPFTFGTGQVDYLWIAKQSLCLLEHGVMSDGSIFVYM